MKRYAITCLAAAALAGLSACSNDNATPALTGYFRVVNGITDSSAMHANIASIPDIGPLSFGSASGNNTIPTGNYDATIKPNDTQTFQVTNVSIDHNNVSTVFTYGTISASSQGGFVAEQQIGDPAANQFNAQFVHDAYSESLTVGTLTFYVVAPGTDITTATGYPAQFKQNVANQGIAQTSDSKYEVVVTNAAGVKIYDSGSISLLQNGANVLQIAAIDAPGNPNGSPISLVVLDNKGGTNAYPNVP